MLKVSLKPVAMSCSQLVAVVLRVAPSVTVVEAPVMFAVMA